MPQKLDIILFGATGFTGTHAIPLLAKFSKNYQFSWGIAGRSEEKLRALLNDSKKQTEIPIIIADMKKESSLKEMARRARIIIDCCGPFCFYGEAVVKACVEEGTHYVDVAAETQFMEAIQLKYHAEAQEKGVYIISGCGFASIPVDLGTVFLQKKFAGTLNSVVAYVSIQEKNRSVPGSMINYGSWESAIYNIFPNAKELKEILWKDKSFFMPELKLTVIPHKTNVVEGWALPFPVSDPPVARRTQRYFYEQDSKRPVQVESYFVITSFLYTLMLLTGVPIMWILSKFSYGRNLLLKYPEIFTLGYISRRPPNKEKTEGSSFSTVLYGKGWKEKLPNADDQYVTPPNRSITAKISGRDPAYGATCICLVLAAITVITEKDKMPPRGGVYPPGYAFANTSLVEQLTKNDVKFEILHEKKKFRTKLS